MKLRIENWIEKNNFTEDTSILFNESVICFKAGAYRSSLLFSYLAFMTIIKERIIAGSKPDLFPPGHWQSIILKLNNEDLWETAAFDATQTREKLNNDKSRKKDPIFNINENIRHQIEYWKNRRNDCAHAKNNIINTSHVESFWAFIESNMPKITIEGGMFSLMNKIRRHFNPTITPPDKDITPLVQEIESSVEKIQLKYFWENLLDGGELNFDLSEKIQGFINRSLEVNNNNNVNDSLIVMIKDKPHYLKQFLSNYPDKLLRFNFTEEEVREFWNTKLTGYNKNTLPVYSSLLRSGLIPQKEIAEANKIILHSLQKYTPSVDEHMILAANGFLNTFKQQILNNTRFVGTKSYLWVNDNAELISGIIKNYPVDLEIIKRLTDHYGQENSSNFLIERLDILSVSENEKFLEYKDLIKYNNITIPERLSKYFN